MPLNTNFQHSVTTNYNDNIFFYCNKQIKQELAELLEEAKADALRRLPLYSCKITGFRFMCSKCYDRVYDSDRLLQRPCVVELCREIEKIDNKPKVCFITAFEVYYKSLRELFPTMKVDCYIKKPITTDDLVERIKSELFTAASSS
jgi:two-component SAPR family response regulator